MRPRRARAVCPRAVLLIGVRDAVRFGACQFALGEVQVDLVSIKIGVVSVAVCVVESECLHCLVVDHAHFMRHQTRLVESRLPVCEHYVAILEMLSKLW